MVGLSFHGKKWFLITMFISIFLIFALVGWTSHPTPRQSINVKTISSNWHQFTEVSKPQTLDLFDENDTLIYSRAYVDFRWGNPGPNLRLIGFQGCNNSRLLSVGFRGTDQRTETLELKPSLIWKECPFHWSPNCNWDGIFLSAPIPEKFISKIDDLSSLVVSEINGTRSIILDRILPLPTVSELETGPPLHKFGLCVQPLYLYGDWLQLVQFLEVWRALGVDKVWIYETSITRTVAKFLEAYSKHGFVERVPWPLFPKSTQFDPNKNLYRMGAIAAINDCVLRTIGLVKFLAVIDLDEYILPAKGNPQILGLLEQLAERFPKAGAFRFEQIRTLYPKKYKIPKSVDLRKLNFAQMDKLQLDFVNEQGPPKVFVRPERVKILAVHDVISLLPGFQRQIVEAKEAKLYHLRRFPGGAFYRNASNSPTLYPILKPIIPVMGKNFQQLIGQFWKGNSNDLTIISTDIDIQKGVVKCLSNWKKTGCKVPHKMCAKLLEKFKSEWLIRSSDDQTDKLIDRFLMI